MGLLAARDEQEAAEFDLKVARAERTAMESEIHEVLKAYSLAVLGRLGPKSVAGETLPRLSHQRESKRKVPA